MQPRLLYLLTSWLQILIFSLEFLVRWSAWRWRSLQIDSRSALIISIVHFIMIFPVYSYQKRLGNLWMWCFSFSQDKLLSTIQKILCIQFGLLDRSINRNEYDIIQTKRWRCGTKEHILFSFLFLKNEKFLSTKLIILMYQSIHYQGINVENSCTWEFFKTFEHITMHLRYA